MKKRNLIIAATGMLLMSFTATKPAPDQVMSTVPSSPEGQVTLENWNQHPYNKWSFRNPGIFPNLKVPRAGDVYEFERMINEDIESWEVRGNKDLSILEALQGDHTDGIVVIKDGVIVYEKYFGDFGERDPHIWASSTKSLTSMIAGIMIEDGRLDPSKKVVEYLPEMQGSGFGDLHIQQVLNMVSALDFSEDYVDLKPGTVHYEYFRRMGLTPAYDLMQLDPMQDDTPRGSLEILPRFTTHPDKTPGEVFEYHSPNVDVIGMVLSRISGQSLDELASELIWQQIGAEHDALMMTDVAFNPIATGGFASTLRDFARFGYTVLNDGKMGENQIFPAAYILETMDLSEEEMWAGERSMYRNDMEAPSYDKHFQGYKNFWWVHDSEAQVMTARGIHGQGIYIDKSNNVVIATYGSAPTASNATRETHKVKMDALQTIAERV